MVLFVLVIYGLAFVAVDSSGGLFVARGGGGYFLSFCYCCCFVVDDYCGLVVFLLVM